MPTGALRSNLTAVDQNRTIMDAAQLLRNCRLFLVTPAKAGVSGDGEIHFDKRPDQPFRASA